MPEHGLSATEMDKEIYKHAEHEDHTRRDRFASIAEAVLLSLVALMAGWSGYAAAKWGTASSLSLAKASSTRTKANQAAIEATQIRTLDPLSREGRLMARHFFSAAIEAELDKQGRVMIPGALAQSAGLGREVVVAGVYDHLEIWDRTTWREQLKEVEGSAEHVAERLAAKRD